MENRVAGMRESVAERVEIMSEDINYLEVLEGISTRVVYPRGVRLPTENVYYLQEGICALTHHTREGEENSFLYFKPGMMLNFLESVVHVTGTGSEITGKRYSKFNHAVYTKTECRLLSVRGAFFLEYLEKNPALYKLLLRSLSENLINLLALSTDIVSKPAGVRVCQVILDFMTDDDPPQVPRYFTYPEIAFYLSMHEMTVTKVFKALRQEGIIDRVGRTARVLRSDKLVDIVNGDRELKYGRRKKGV
jgi:CRP-like cAMP-binding protein